MVLVVLNDGAGVFEDGEVGRPASREGRMAGRYRRAPERFSPWPAPVADAAAEVSTKNTNARTAACVDVSDSSASVLFMGARFHARRHAVNEVVARAANWANGQPEVPVVVVVGSYAYGRPRMGSDVDLVILSEQVKEHLADLAFAHRIAPGGRVIRCEQWGAMHERRVRLGSGLLVEFGLATPDWAGVPLDAGTAKVLSNGCKIVADDGTMTAALESIGLPAPHWQPVK